MRLKFENEIQKCCAVCEHAVKLEFKGQYVCKYKDRLANVEPDFVCRHFEPDLLKLEPIPRKKFNPDI